MTTATATAATPDTIEAMRARYKAKALNEWGMGFAKDVLARHDAGRPLSEKQMHWVQKLAEPQPEKKAIALASQASVAAIAALFDKASQHLKYPALLIPSEIGTLRLYRCGPKSKMPGAISVEARADKAWFGRILPTGVFEPSYLDAAKNEVLEALELFAADPVKAATNFGKLTGVCCFCGRGLDDERSTEVGYGPVCARKWGFAWGKQ